MRVSLSRAPVFIRSETDGDSALSETRPQFLYAFTWEQVTGRLVGLPSKLNRCSGRVAFVRGGGKRANGI